MSNPNLVRKVANSPTGSSGEVAFSNIIEQANNLQNFLINGNFDFWQRAGLTLTGINYPGTLNVDRWQSRGNLGFGVLTSAASTNVPNPASFYSLQWTCTTTATPSNQMRALGQTIEGNVLRAFAGKTVTLSFWVMSNQTGTWGISIKNAASTKAYHMTYTIDVANVWEFKSVTFTHDTSGTWNYNNASGLEIAWMLATSTEYQTSTFDAWTSDNNFRSPVGQPNFFSSTSNVFRLSQVMLNTGDRPAPFSLFAKNYDHELIACERYYQHSGTDPNSGPSTNDIHYVAASNGEFDNFFPFRTRMRAAPTVGTLGTGIGVTATRATGWWNSNSSGTGIQNIDIGWFADAEI